MKLSLEADSARQFKRIGVIGAVNVAVLGALGLLGWITGFQVRTSIRADLKPISPSTAVAFLLLSAILLIHIHRGWRGKWKVVAAVIVALVAVFGILKLVEYLTGSINLEDVLLPNLERWNRVPTGHMSPSNGILFFLSGLALLSLILQADRVSPHRLVKDWIGGLASLVAVCGLAFVVAYLLGTQLMYAGDVIPTSTLSALAFGLLGVAMVAAAGPDAFPVRWFIGTSTRARLMRAFVPPMILLAIIQLVLNPYVHLVSGIDDVLVSVIIGVTFVLFTAAMVSAVSRSIGSAIDRAEAERKQAEAKLRESEEHYRQLVELSPEAIVVHCEGKVVFINAAGVRIFGGSSPSEIIGKAIKDLIHPNYWEKAKERIQWMQKENKPAPPAELVYNRLDGGAFDVETSGVPITHEGKPASLTMIRDITERKRGQEELRKLRAAVDASDEVIFMTDREGVITFTNPEFTRLYGYTAAEIVGKTTPLILKSGKMTPKDYASFWQTLLNKQVVKGELINKTKDGDLLYVEGSVNPVLDERDEIVGFLAIQRDVTERKQAEELLKESEQRYRSLFEHMLDGFAYCKMLYDDQSRPVDFVYLDVNPAFEQLTGLKNVVGKPVSEVIPGIREVSPELFETYGRVVSTGKPESFEFEVKSLALWLFLSVYSSKPGTFVALFEDITARKRAEETLRRSHDELEKQVADRTRELDGRVAQVETLNKAMTNLLQDLRAANRLQRETNQELKRLHEQLSETHVAEQAALLKLSQALLGETDIQKIMDTAVRETAVAFQVEFAALALLEPDGQHLSVRASEGWSPEAVQQAQQVPLEETSALAYAICSRRLLIIPDVARETRFTHSPVWARLGIRASLVTPLQAGDQVLGSLAVENPTPRDWTADEVRLLALFAHTIAQALERARLFEQVSAGRERFQALSTRLLEVQESERRYIARELHDEIGQMLTGLRLLLVSNDDATAQAMPHLLQAQELVGDLMARVRNLSLDLRPAMLDDLGLVPALIWFIGRYETQTRVRVSFNHMGLENKRFAHEVEMTAYRIVQESLTNVARHAEVKAVSVHLWAHDKVLEVQLEDSGRGFDPATALVEGKSSGLAGMRERAILLGGQLTIDSAAGAGTRVLAELPLGDWIERRNDDRLNSARG